MDARNIEGQAYIATSSTIFDAVSAANLDLFTSRDGATMFAGARIGFGGTP